MNFNIFSLVLYFEFENSCAFYSIMQERIGFELQKWAKKIFQPLFDLVDTMMSQTSISFNPKNLMNIAILLNLTKFCPIFLIQES